MPAQLHSLRLVRATPLPMKDRGDRIRGHVFQRGVLVIVLVLSAACFASAWDGQSLTVLSGNAFVAEQGGGTQLRVNLYGLNVPGRERSPGLWRESRHRLNRLLQGTRLTIEDVRVFKDGLRQSLVYLEGDGKCVNEEMVRSGHAWVDPMQCKLVDCGHWYELEKQAREQELGIWASPQAQGLDFSGVPDRGSLSGCPGCQLR